MSLYVIFSGLQLTQHYSQETCSPARGALLTGRYPIHLGLQSGPIKSEMPWGLPLDETTLPQVLQQYNYSTHAVGKWHLGFHKRRFTPIYRGFDDFFGMYQGKNDYFTHGFEGRGFDLRTNKFDENGNIIDDLRWDLVGQYNTYLYSQHTIDIISKMKAQDNPFFIYLAYQSVHAPYSVPQSYVDKYASHFGGKTQQQFAGMVSAMDEGIGNITRVLKESGQDKNTIVVFTSDNGGRVNCIMGEETFSSNYPYRGGKKSLYEGGIRTPTFVWSPGRIMPGKSDAMFHITDWFPTLWNQASQQGKLTPNNLINPHKLDGFNQWLVILQRASSNRTEFVVNIDEVPTFCGHQVPIGAVRWMNWKLILGGGGPPFGWYPDSQPREMGYYCNHDYTNHIELYDIIKDPSEKRNVQHLYPDIVDFLTMKLRAYNSTAIPALRLQSFDPSDSDPRKFNNTWMPWNDGTKEQRVPKLEKIKIDEFQKADKKAEQNLHTGPDDCSHESLNLLLSYM